MTERHGRPSAREKVVNYGVKIILVAHDSVAGLKILKISKFFAKIASTLCEITKLFENTIYNIFFLEDGTNSRMGNVLLRLPLRHGDTCAYFDHWWDISNWLLPLSQAWNMEMLFCHFWPMPSYWGIFRLELYFLSEAYTAQFSLLKHAVWLLSPNAKKLPFVLYENIRFHSVITALLLSRGMLHTGTG